MTDLAKELIAATKPRTETATVCVDGGLFTRLQALHRQLMEEKRIGSDDMGGSQAAREIEALLEQAESCTYDFRFHAVGNTAWKRLKERHAPPKAQVKSARDRGLQPPEFTDAFWPEAIAASLSEVKKAADDEDTFEPVAWDADKVREVTAAWNDAQWGELQAACRLANEAGNALPKRSSGWLQTLTGDEKSEPPEQPAGPDQSSMAGD